MDGKAALPPSHTVQNHRQMRNQGNHHRPPHEVFIPFHAQNITADIHRALTTNQRLSMLVNLFSLLGCGENLSFEVSNNLKCATADPNACDWLIEAGTVPALVLQLHFVMQRHCTTPEEVSQLCHALAILIRHFCRHRNTSTGTNTTMDLGGVEFVNLLAEVLQSWGGKSPTTVTVLSILHSISGSESGTSDILKSRCVLFQVVKVLESQQQSHRYDAGEGNGSIGDSGISADFTEDTAKIKETNASTSLACLLEALGLLKNLTYYSTEDNDCVLLLDIPPFLPSLTALPSVVSPNSNGKALERLSAVFRNLAISSSTRSIMAEEPDVLGALVQLASIANNYSGITRSKVDDNNRRGSILAGSSSNRLRQVDVVAIRNLLHTLIQLAMGNKDSCVRLILYGDGVVVQILKRWMAQLHFDEQDNHGGSTAGIRKRAARCLRLLANHDESAAMLLLQGSVDEGDNKLVSALSRAATQDKNREVRTEAAEALVKCAAFVQAGQATAELFQSILDGLAQIAAILVYSNRSSSVAPETFVSPSLLARALKDQAAILVNRKHLAERPELLEALAIMAVRPFPGIHDGDENDSTKEDACCALMHLSADNSNRPHLATTPCIVDALVQNAMSQQPPGQRANHENENVVSSKEKRREYAVRSLVNLVMAECNRQIMVRQHHVLQSLIQYAVSTSAESAEELKEQVKEVIMILVSEL